MLGPLSGRLVLDFSTLLPGPLATLMLAQAGADVIKIERPGGEDMRGFAPQWDGVSAVYALLNRSKRVMELDLKATEALSVLRPLIERADVVVEQFRPGVMARLGLGYDALAAINPRVVMCSITGYGQTGPKAATVGHDLNYIAETGLLALAPGGLPPAQIADIAGGSFPAVINILLALMEADRTGRGRHLDIAMTDACFTFALFAQAAMQAGDGVPAPSGDLLTGRLARYNLYPARDGRLIAVAALEPKFWAVVCDTLGLGPDERDDHREPERVKARLGAAIAARTSTDIASLFAGKEACVSVVATLDEARADPHFAERDGRQTVTGAGGAIMPALRLPLDRGLVGSSE